MKEEYKERLPQWYKDTKNYDLILTDDIDSLLSCAILQKVKGWDIEYCMLFKLDKEQSLDYMGKTSNATNEVIGVDLALQNGKTFDNHVSRLGELDQVNEECINLNFIKDVTRKNYFKKYNLSTVLLLWGLYDLPIPESEEGKMILLAIDGTFSSHFSKYQNDRDMNRFYMCEVLGLEELYQCQLRHKQYEFDDIKKKYKLNNKIRVHKGKLQTDIDLLGINLELIDTDIWCELPKKAFQLHKVFRDIQMPLSYNTTKLSDITKNPYSVALTGRDFICYSEEIPESEVKQWYTQMKKEKE